MHTLIKLDCLSGRVRALVCQLHPRVALDTHGSVSRAVGPRMAGRRGSGSA